jgi:hypothetical protein
MDQSKQLRQMIADKITEMDQRALPELFAMASTEQGAETLESMIFSMCADRGISIQTAMSTLESEMR